MDSLKLAAHTFEGKLGIDVMGIYDSFQEQMDYYFNKETFQKFYLIKIASFLDPRTLFAPGDSRLRTDYLNSVMDHMKVFYYDEVRFFCFRHVAPFCRTHMTP